MGKTYTVDPISKRRLDNHGESNKYYTKNHHEAIISEEEWDKVQDILKSRYRTNENVSDPEGNLIEIGSWNKPYEEKDLEGV